MRKKIKVQQIMTEAKQVEEIIKENGEKLSGLNYRLSSLKVNQGSSLRGAIEHSLIGVL